MPYANNHGVRIYYEVEGQGPPVVLAHGMGFGSNLNAWRSTGYTDALRNDFQLILFDFRGHGRSDKSDDVSASKSAPADDVVAVLDSLEIIKAHYLGYSMGAAEGFRQAVRHADRFYSFILGGMTPGKWPEEMVKAMEISAEWVKLRRTDPEAYFQQMEHLIGHPLTPEEKSELLTRDERAGNETLTPRHERSELTPRELAGILVPCVLYCGSLDPFYAGAQESVQYMPRAAFISLDGLNHITAFSRSDAVVRFVKPLLLRLSQM
ncbi:MAG TPA: alpha/beta hydrolase [Dehalococcoidales bacterium]|nr:alpha/beta hydrolase [Dehalococcoidales bacterium]